MHVKASAITLIKWDHFDILAKGKINYHCKIKETLFIQELEPAFNLNVEVRRFVPHVQLLEHFIDTFLHGQPGVLAVFLRPHEFLQEQVCDWRK